MIYEHIVAERDRLRAALERYTVGGYEKAIADAVQVSQAYGSVQFNRAERAEREIERQRQALRWYMDVMHFHMGCGPDCEAHHGDALEEIT
jgi:hypothetical protein